MFPAVLRVNVIRHVSSAPPAAVWLSQCAAFRTVPSLFSHRVVLVCIVCLRFYPAETSPSLSLLSVVPSLRLWSWSPERVALQLQCSSETLTTFTSDIASSSHVSASRPPRRITAPCFLSRRKEKREVLTQRAQISGDNPSMGRSSQAAAWCTQADVTILRCAVVLSLCTWIHGWVYEVKAPSTQWLYNKNGILKHTHLSRSDTGGWCLLLVHLFFCQKREILPVSSWSETIFYQKTLY